MQSLRIRIGRTARTTTAAGVAAVAAAALVAGCSSSSSPAPASSASASSSSTAPALTGSVTVFAASSLDKIFPVLAKQFEAANPGVTIKFSYGGSDTLAAQITSGAPADVFAAASTTTMDTIVKAGDNATTPAVFTRNELEIAVAPGNPKGITGLSDLTKSGIKVALCASSVPCGEAAQKALTAAAVKLTPVTQTQDDASALSDIELGQVDAALVYKTDILSAGTKVTGVNFAAAAQAINTYPIAVVKNAPNAAAAQAFVTYVLSAQGQQTLQNAGFMTP